MPGRLPSNIGSPANIATGAAYIQTIRTACNGMAWTSHLPAPIETKLQLLDQFDTKPETVIEQHEPGATTLKVSPAPANLAAATGGAGGPTVAVQNAYWGLAGENNGR
jgi:hypothetical protein